MNAERDAFVKALKAWPRSKMPFPDVLEAFETHVRSAYHDFDFGKAGLEKMLASLEGEGIVVLPSDRKSYEKHPTARLPHWIRIPHEKAERVFVRTEWHEKLVPLVQGRTETEIQRFRAINAYLAGTRGKAVPMVPVNSRSLHIFGQEKILLSMVRKDDVIGGSLTLADLHCYVPYETFLIHDFPTTSISRDVLVVENRQSYHVFKERNRIDGKFRGVILGSGGVIRGEVPALVALCKNHGVGRICYFGDLDTPGFEIPLSVRASLEELSPELDITLDLGLYRECLKLGKPQPSSYKSGHDDIKRWNAIRNAVSEWMADEELFTSIHDIIAGGHRLAQEWVC